MACGTCPSTIKVPRSDELAAGSGKFPWAWRQRLIWHACSCRFNLYFMPYWINVVWLDIVTYLHHHGPSDPNEKIPWYRGGVRTPGTPKPDIYPPCPQ